MVLSYKEGGFVEFGVISRIWESGIYCFEVNGPIGVGVWKRISRGWGVFFEIGRYKVGDGTKIYGVGIIRQRILFRNCLVLLLVRRRGLWIICSFLMIIFSVTYLWLEADLMIVFDDLMYSLRLRQGGEDRIWWIPSKRRKLEARSFFLVLSSLGGFIFSLKEYLDSQCFIESESRCGCWLLERFWLWIIWRREK